MQPNAVHVYILIMLLMDAGAWRIGQGVTGIAAVTGIFKAYAV